MAPSKSLLRPRQVTALLFNLLFFPALLFLLPGDWHWTEAWVYCSWYFPIFGISFFYLARKNPALLRERFRKPGTGGQKGWDKLFFMAFGPVLLAYFVVIPLDARRLGWSRPFPWGWEALGFLLLFPATYLVFRSMVDNSFTSPYVRIQKERRQKVVSTGVYGFVRHPMYLGGLFWFFGTPLLLGSAWGLGLAGLLAALFSMRIIGEESVLMRELKGYAAYRRKVRYRLFPGIW